MHSDAGYVRCLIWETIQHVRKKFLIKEMYYWMSSLCYWRWHSIFQLHTMTQQKEVGR